MVVKEIFSLKQNKLRSSDLFLKGNICNEVDDFFTYPISSKDIGVYYVKNIEKIVVDININMVEFKCILTVFHDKTLVITLLHK